VTYARHSGENRNPVFSISSGCRIKPGMTEYRTLWMDTNSLFPSQSLLHQVSRSYGMAKIAYASTACGRNNIQEALVQYGEKVKRDTGVDFSMRIGLNSGPVIVGAIGDDLRMDYTAVRDTTNLASRMESLAKPGAILLSKATHRMVKDYFECNLLGELEIKGKEGLQEAYELLRVGEVTTRIGASVAKGLTRFVGRKNSMGALMEAWEKAEAGSGQVVGLVGEAGVGKSRLLIEFRNRLALDSVTYLQGRCLHFGGAMAYLPFLDIVRGFFPIEEVDREFIRRKKMAESLARLDEKALFHPNPARGHPFPQGGE
jgi:hypothetical protein